MALYLNNLDLNGNQLQKAVVHPLGTAPSTAQEGQIYYDTGDNVIYVNTSTTVNSPTWVNMQAGDITGITAGTGMTGDATSGAVTLNVVGGTGITANAGDIAIDSTVATLDGSQTLTNKTIAASQVTEISALTASEGAQLENINSTTISATQWGYLGAASGAITNTDVSVSAGNLKDTLEAGFPGDAVNLGDSGDTITVPGDMTVSGDLTVTGDTITVNTSSLTVKDPLIVIANNNAADAIDTGFYSQYVANIAGTNATRYAGIFRDASADGDPWSFFDTLTDEPGTTINTAHASFDYAPIKAGAIQAVDGFVGDLTGAVTGNASTATKISSITNTNIVQLAASQTLTNKTIDANGTGNSITNIDIGNMTAAVVQLSSESFSDNDTSFMTSAAINDRFALINANTTGTAAGLSATLAVASGGTGATSLDGAGIVEKSGAQTISGAKTFSGGLILDDGSGASPILKFRNQDNDYWTLSTQNSTNNLLFYEGTSLRVTFADGGDVVIPGSIDLGGSIDVDGTMEADAITLGGASVFAADTTDTLGTSDTLVPTQAAVKTYVDAQTSGDSNTGGRQAFVLNSTTTGVAATSTTVFTITHGMGSSRNYGVEIIRNSANSGGGETVIVDVARPTDTTITVTFAAAPTAGDYTALVCKY